MIYQLVRLTCILPEGHVGLPKPICHTPAFLTTDQDISRIICCVCAGFYGRLRLYSRLDAIGRLSEKVSRASA